MTNNGQSLIDFSQLGDIFSDIYDHDKWTNGSGPGSSPENTIEYRAFVEQFIKFNQVRSVSDLGCGDWQFSRLIDWSGIDYTGLDVVTGIIESNRARFGDSRTQFRLIERLEDLPGGDLLLCKEVLQHLTSSQVVRLLSEISRLYRFALITNAISPVGEVNREIAAGEWRPVRLDQNPFTSRAALVMVYHPRSADHLWRNGVFLLLGDDQDLAR